MTGHRALGPAPDVAAAPGWPPELVLLLGDEGGDLLRAVVATAGGDLEAWAPVYVAHDPGTSTVVQHDATVRWPSGRRTVEPLVTATGRRIPDGATVMEADGLRVGAWTRDRDPALPGLHAVLDPDALPALLRDLGLDLGPVDVGVVAYRPGRRAVVEVTGPRGRAFLKVVRPHKVDALCRRHLLLADHLPVPRLVGRDGSGVVALSVLPGRTAREAVVDGGPLPGLDALEALLDRLPTDLVDGSPLVGGPLARVPHFAAVVGATVPEEGPRVARVVEALDAASAPDLPVVAVHGDLYEAQVMVQGDRPTGLLDIDGVGPGHRIDDVADLLAHLDVLSGIPGHARARPWAEELLLAADARLDPGELRRRTGAAVLALASGPFRVLDPGWRAATADRLDRARCWAEAGGRRARPGRWP